LKKKVYNHVKDLVSKSKYVINVEDENYLGEDEIYEKIMLEIEEDRKVKFR